ncbi:MAG: hypothetical protein Tsb005_06940 [Gammaproteobacteria bacterium]
MPEVLKHWKEATDLLGLVYKPHQPTAKIKEVTLPRYSSSIVIIWNKIAPNEISQFKAYQNQNGSEKVEILGRNLSIYPKKFTSEPNLNAIFDYICNLCHEFSELLPIIKTKLQSNSTHVKNSKESPVSPRKNNNNNNNDLNNKHISPAKLPEYKPLELITIKTSEHTPFSNLDGNLNNTASITVIINSIKYPIEKINYDSLVIISRHKGGPITSDGRDNYISKSETYLSIKFRDGSTEYYSSWQNFIDALCYWNQKKALPTQALTAFQRAAENKSIYITLPVHLSFVKCIENCDSTNTLERIIQLEKAKGSVLIIMQVVKQHELTTLANIVQRSRQDFILSSFAILTGAKYPARLWVQPYYVQTGEQRYLVIYNSAPYLRKIEHIACENALIICCEIDNVGCISTKGYYSTYNAAVVQGVRKQTLYIINAPDKHSLKQAYDMLRQKELLLNFPVLAYVDGDLVDLTDKHYHFAPELRFMSDHNNHIDGIEKIPKNWRLTPENNLKVTNSNQLEVTKYNQIGEPQTRSKVNNLKSPDNDSITGFTCRIFLGKKTVEENLPLRSPINTEKLQQENTNFYGFPLNAEAAYKKLQMCSPQVNDLLKPLLFGLLFEQEFINYLKQHTIVNRLLLQAYEKYLTALNNTVDDMHSEDFVKSAVDDVECCLNDPNIMFHFKRYYFEYILEGKIDVHPLFLHAVAATIEHKLLIWEEDKKLDQYKKISPIEIYHNIKKINYEKEIHLLKKSKRCYVEYFLPEDAHIIAAENYSNKDKEQQAIQEDVSLTVNEATQQRDFSIISDKANKQFSATKIIRKAVNIDRDFNCLGLTREKAYELLKNNLEKVTHYLMPVVLDALLEKDGFSEFIKEKQGLTRKEVYQLSYNISNIAYLDLLNNPNEQIILNFINKIRNSIDIKLFQKSLSITSHYLTYLFVNCQDSNKLPILVLHALADIQKFKLFIWEICAPSPEKYPIKISERYHEIEENKFSNIIHLVGVREGNNFKLPGRHTKQAFLEKFSLNKENNKAVDDPFQCLGYTEKTAKKQLVGYVFEIDHLLKPLLCSALLDLEKQFINYLQNNQLINDAELLQIHDEYIADATQVNCTVQNEEAQQKLQKSTENLIKFADDIALLTDFVHYCFESEDYKTHPLLLHALAKTANYKLYFLTSSSKQKFANNTVNQSDDLKQFYEDKENRCLNQIYMIFHERKNCYSVLYQFPDNQQLKLELITTDASILQEQHLNEISANMYKTKLKKLNLEQDRKKIAQHDVSFKFLENTSNVKDLNLSNKNFKNDYRKEQKFVEQEESKNQSNIPASGNVNVSSKINNAKQEVPLLVKENTSAEMSNVSSLFNKRDNFFTIASGSSQTKKYRYKDLTFTLSKLVGDGDCGYQGMGLSRTDAYQLLQNNLAKISDLIRPLVQAALLESDFVNYLKKTNLAGAGLLKIFANYADYEHDKASGEAAMKQLEQIWSRDLSIQAAFVTYDIHVKKQWAHPLILHALARLQEFKLLIWQPADHLADYIKPLIEYARDETNKNAETVHLFYNGLDHFDKLICQEQQFEYKNTFSFS